MHPEPPPAIDTVPPEFSRPYELARLGADPVDVQIEADAAERAALAERFGLLSLDRLEASFRLKRRRMAVADLGRQEVIELTGHVVGDAVQQCVVTLTPLPATFEEWVEERFYETDTAPEELEIVIDLENDEAPDPVFNGRLDLGEIAAQYTSLALDPHPRAPDAVLEAAQQTYCLDEEALAEEGAEAGGPVREDEADESAPNPFAVLERLKQQRH